MDFTQLNEEARKCFHRYFIGMVEYNKKHFKAVKETLYKADIPILMLSYEEIVQDLGPNLKEICKFILKADDIEGTVVEARINDVV